LLAAAAVAYMIETTQAQAVALAGCVLLLQQQAVVVH
jgi:hypothetical protein